MDRTTSKAVSESEALPHNMARGKTIANHLISAAPTLSESLQGILASQLSWRIPTCELSTFNPFVSRIFRE